jgi:hypothetical protein
VLNTFEFETDGAFPYFGPPLVDHLGNVYATANAGGDLSCGAPNSCGTVFEWSPVGHRFRILHKFSGPPEDGNFPMSDWFPTASGIFTERRYLEAPTEQELCLK